LAVVGCSRGTASDGEIVEWGVALEVWEEEEKEEDDSVEGHGLQ